MLDAVMRLKKVYTINDVLMSSSRINGRVKMLGLATLFAMVSFCVPAQAFAGTSLLFPASIQTAPVSSPTPAPTPARITITLFGREINLVLDVGLLGLLIALLLFVLLLAAVLLALLARRRTRQVRQSEAHLRTIVETALDGVVSIDHIGRITAFNPAAERIFGYESGAVLGKDMADLLIPPSLRDAHRKGLEHYNATGEGPILDQRIEIVGLHADGTEFPVELSVTRIGTAEPPSFTGFVRDIAERKRIEEQLLQSQKMEAIGLLAGGIAHDFNNLLTVITGYSDMILKKMPADDPLRRSIEAVRDAGDRASTLTGQLLAFSRKQVLQPKVHNLNDVVTGLEKMLRRIIRESVDFRVVLDPELGNIRADPGKIEQVIMNLAINASDAVPNVGRLTIETKNVYLDEDYVSQHIEISPGPFVRLSVTDTGEGMDEQTQRRIFDPFFTTKEMGKGTGLGLSTVHGIVKQSGGDVTVYSEIGHGTTFKIYIPRVDEKAQASNREIDEVNDFSGTETILLVEDEESVRNLAREILTSSGYKVLEAANGAAALSICDNYSEPVHLLLTDVIMPNMSGNELKNRIFELYPGLKVLFMSGYTDDSIAHSGILDSDIAFIEKPFSPDGLARKVRDVLGH
jgi:PAS domain S-box-containing protein